MVRTSRTAPTPQASFSFRVTYLMRAPSRRMSTYRATAEPKAVEDTYSDRLTL